MVGVGDVLAGKYRVEQVLGKGGMGYVVSAMHTQLDQRVAVKFMVPELCEHPEAVARFLREARAAVRIRSEHVARVLDVGTLDDGTPYMVMEFLSGRDLATELEETEKLPIGQAVDFVLQACEALAEAHVYGIIHRDLKPANLFLTRHADGSALVKVLDFGISKAITDEATSGSESLTASQSLIGSPHYMSPEQVRRPKTVDVRSDIWALGVILYELISGDRPFGGDTPMSVLAAVVSDPAPSLRAVRPELASGLETVILRCLAKDPNQRYASIAELALALGPFAPPSAAALVSRIQGITRAQALNVSGRPSSGSVGAVTPVSQDDSALATLPSPILLSEPRPRRTETDFGRSGIDRASRFNWAWMVGALAVLSVFGGLMYLLGSSRADHDPQSTLEAASASDAATASPLPVSSSLKAPESALPVEPPPAPAKSLQVAAPPAPEVPTASPPQASPAAPIRAKRSAARSTPVSARSQALPTPSSSAPPPAPRVADPLEERR